MPLQMASELRFPMGVTIALDRGAVDDFLSLMKRVSSPIGAKHLIEIYKQHFCKVSGDCYAKSSSLEWAESDLTYQAKNASQDAPNFIAAVYDAFEVINNQGAAAPSEQHINKILIVHQIPFLITNGNLINTQGGSALCLIFNQRITVPDNHRPSPLFSTCFAGLAHHIDSE